MYMFSLFITITLSFPQCRMVLKGAYTNVLKGGGTEILWANFCSCFLRHLYFYFTNSITYTLSPPQHTHIYICSLRYKPCNNCCYSESGFLIASTRDMEMCPLTAHNWAYTDPISSGVFSWVNVLIMLADSSNVQPKCRNHTGLRTYS